MHTPVDVTDRLRRTSRPVLFQTGIADAPCSVLGTAFLVGFRGEVFVITARHVADEDDEVRSMRIFPSDAATQPLNFQKWWRINAVRDNDEEDEEGSDLLIVRVNQSQIRRSDRENSQVVLLDYVPDWFRQRFISDFFLCGYPRTHNSVDYMHGHVSTTQFFIAGCYVRPDRH